MVAKSTPKTRQCKTTKKAPEQIHKEKVGKMEEKIHIQNESAAQLIQSRNLEKIMSVMKERPKVANHVLNLIEIGAFDSLDKEGAAQDPEQCEKLPGSCNKVALLSKKVILDIILTCVPDYSEWFRTLPRNEPKKSYIMLFGYMAHISLDSALPTKKLPVLTKFFQDRWRKYGCRLGGDEDAPNHTDTSIVSWMLNKQAVYWSLNVDAKVLHCLDSEVELPDSMKGLGAELRKVHIEEPLDCFKAVLVISGMKRSCLNLWETEKRGLADLDLPWYKKEVPLEADDGDLQSQASAGVLV